MNTALVPNTSPIRNRVILSRPRPDNAVDEQILARMRQGDDWAMSLLYDRYARLVFSLALRVLSDRDAAEEMVQEVFIKVWRRAGDFDPERAKLSTWIARIAHNQAIDEWRRRSHRPSLASPPQNESSADTVLPIDAVVADWDHQKIVRALGRIPHEQRQVIEMAYWDGLTHKEIAEKLGEPMGTVKTRIRRGMQKLKVLLEQQED